MNPILFNAAKAAERVMHAQHARANNLSNADTVGFKSLIEFTTPQRLEGSGFDSSVTTRTNLALTDFSQGPMIHTGNVFNAAISGDGFFSVAGLEGELPELYSRTGEFQVDADGFVLIQGRSLLTEDGPLQLPDYESVAISDDGIVSVVPPGGGVSIAVGVLKLVQPDHADVTLDRTGLYRSKSGEPFEVAGPVAIKHGYVEGSNVSGFSEMVGIMNLTRQFEVQVKVMSKADELAKIGNQLMRV